MSMGNVILTNRKNLGLTQEQLASRLEVTNQAVSKWESDQCCPDIQLLPRIADLFGITLDALFERDGQVKQTIDGLPWEDDKTLRAVLYVGHTLVGQEEISKHLSKKEITFCYEGPALNVDSYFAVECGDVQGSVDAGTNVTCGNVEGSVDAGTNVTCLQVHGDVDAGTSVTCGDVGGDVDAGTNVTCGNVGGDVDAGTDVTCAAVEGDIDAGCGVTIRK